MHFNMHALSATSVKCDAIILSRHCSFGLSRGQGHEMSCLEKGFQLCKVEVGVEARGLMPDGALLRGFDLVPVQLLELASLASCGTHLRVTQQQLSPGQQAACSVSEQHAQ